MSAGTKVFNILLAEDNAADVEMVRAALREHHVPYALEVVHDGAKAAEALRRWDDDPKAQSLDLCILDMHLPKCDGEGILNTLRSTEKYAQTPVIVMSGVHSPDVEKAATKHAAMVVFQKPSSVEEYLRLGSIVRDVLGKRGGAAV